MSYTPPVASSIHFDFIDVQKPPLFFNFVELYSPPGSAPVFFDFTVPLIQCDFEFAPEVPPPITKEMLLSLGVRLHGQVYKYWICYVIKGKQYVRRYGKEGLKNPWWTSTYQIKFAAGVKAWQNLDEDGKIYWRDIGVRKKEPLPSFQTFLSAWMKDEVNLVSFRHIRNLSTR